MQKASEEKVRELLLTAPVPENEKIIRSLCCEIYTLSKKDGDPSALDLCRKKLRKLENRICIGKTQCLYGLTDLSAFMENICLCADILLSDAGASLNAEIEDIKLACCPKIIAQGFLNLLSNAVKFSSDRKIRAAVKNCEDFAYISVENSAELNFNSSDSGDGVKCAQNAARLHGGVLMYCAGGGTVRAGFSVSTGLEAQRSYDVPYFSSYLSDEFSVVKIGLSDALSPSTAAAMT